MRDGHDWDDSLWSNLTWICTMRTNLPLCSHLQWNKWENSKLCNGADLNKELLWCPNGRIYGGNSLAESFFLAGVSSVM